MEPNETDSTDTEFDAERLAVALDQMRETMRAAVAGLMADGFTDREARALLAGVFAANVYKSSDEEPCRICLRSDCQGGCI